MAVLGDVRSLLGAAANRALDLALPASCAGCGQEGAALTTLTALVLQGHTWTVAHVGDTRAWLLRDGECVQLTQDHALDHPDLRSQLTRAMGLDDSVRVDFLQGELHAGDTFMLTSDGVHHALKRRRLVDLACEGSAQEASDAIVRAALDAGGRDNATALVLRVRGLASGALADAQRLAAGVGDWRRLVG